MIISSWYILNDRTNTNKVFFYCKILQHNTITYDTTQHHIKYHLQTSYNMLYTQTGLHYIILVCYNVLL
jgi:hypothetical protein